MKPIAMTPSEAWRIFWPEQRVVQLIDLLRPVGRAELGEQLALDIEAGNITPGVLEEIESCLDRDWCAGKVLSAALVLLATHGRLERYDPAWVYSRRPRTRLINGDRYVVG